MRLLLVEDDERIVEFLSRGLDSKGYSVDVVNSGPEGLEYGQSDAYRVIVLDLMLPGMHGREVCQQLRVAGVRTPILMLTAMDALEDVVEGLRLGADDYMTKPFSFVELLARLEALARRGGDYAIKPSRLAVGDLVFDRETLEVWRGDDAIQMTSKELALLELLMTASGKVVSRAQILENVWGASSDPLTNVVDVYIRRLRAKIDGEDGASWITTIRGRGYRMVAPATGGPPGRIADA